MTEYIHLGDEDRTVGPLVIARAVHDQIMAGNDARISSRLAGVLIENNPFGGWQFTIHFHQSVVNDIFKFNADLAEKDPIGDVTSKASELKQLNEDLGLLGSVIQVAYDTNDWEFAELDAASISGTGGLTDYEFKYETGTTSSSFSGREMDKAIEKVIG